MRAEPSTGSAMRSAPKPERATIEVHGPRSAHQRDRLHPVAARHRHVEEHDVGLQRAGLLDPVEPVGGLADDVDVGSSPATARSAPGRPRRRRRGGLGSIGAAPRVHIVGGAAPSTIPSSDDRRPHQICGCVRASLATCRAMSPPRRSSPARRPSSSASSRTTPRSRRSSSARGQARQEHFGDATDLCSLVNAKSGGCAEDCGFCAQSRFAEAETPMHAMMEPEQILEHARAAEAAGRAPLLHGHPGPGAVQARLREGPRGRAARRRAHEPQALRVGRPHERRPREGAQGRRASSACTTTSRRPSPTTRRSRPPSATRAGCARSTRSARPAWRPASAAS